MTEYFIFLSAGIGLTLSLIGVWLSWIINAGAERQAVAIVVHSHICATSDRLSYACPS